VSLSSQARLSNRQEPVADFYVATEGNDSWSGRLPTPNAAGTDGPFATLAQARDAIREIKAANQFNGPITVMVRGGTHRLSEPLVLTAQDSGTDQCSITYIAYPGEKPVLSGGKVIADWTPYQGNIMQCILPEVREGKRKFGQLFFNGQRQRRARHPNYDPDDPLYGGWAFIEQPLTPTTFRYEGDPFLRDWAKPQQGEIFVFPAKCWDNDIIPIKQVDRDNRIITLQRPPFYDSFLPLTAGNRFYVANLLEELDQPGEWCLDTEAGVVYFWPPTGLVESGQITAPVAYRLIALRGTSEEPVRYINIVGFTFTQTLSLFPQPRQKAPSARAAEDPVQLFNLPQSGGQAIYLQYAEDCRIENNFFDAVGGDGVRLEDYNARNQVTGNEIAYAGGHGVCLVSKKGGDPPPSPKPDPDLISSLVRERPKSVRNTISGNHIHHCGVIEKHGIGVYLYGINSVNNVISHNVIHHTPRMGIAAMHGFGRNFIEHNQLHDLGLETCDVGAMMFDRWFVYEPDEELRHGNVVRFNLVRNVVGCGAYMARLAPGGGTAAGGRILTPYCSWGIYLDNSATNTIVYGNIVVGNVLGGIMLLGDVCNNLIENNILAGSSESQICFASMSNAACDNRFVRNIVYFTDPGAKLIHIGRLPDEALAECDYDLYFPAGSQDLVIDLPDVAPGESFAKWQELCYDQHSIVADPLFVDPENGDFRLQPDSPAFKLGFKSIDISRIGLPTTHARGTPES